MFKKFVLLLLVLGFGWSACESTRSSVRNNPAQAPLKIRLAVVPVQGGGNLQGGLSELLTSELIQTGRFIILERASLAEIQAEQSRAGDPGFWQEGGTAARFIPAKILLQVQTVSLGDEQDALIGTITEGKGGGFRLKRAKAMLEVRLIDVGTAQVLESRVVESTATGGDLAAGVGTGTTMLGTAVFNSSAIGKAAKQAIQKSVKLVLEKFPADRWETRIASVREDGKVYIAAGSSDGLSSGRQLNLFRPGEPIIDPSTGIQLAIAERQIGQVRIEDIWEQYSVGTCVSDTLPRRGDILRAAGR